MQSIENVFYFNPYTVPPPYAGDQNTGTPTFSQDSNAIRASVSKTGKTTLVSSHCFLSLANIEDLSWSRNSPPHVPAPNPQPYEDILSAYLDMLDIINGTMISEASPNTRQSRTSSPKSTCNHLVNTFGIPLAIGGHPCRETAYLKFRAQYARDRELQRYFISESQEVLQEPLQQLQRAGFGKFGLKRKQSTFVKEEELEYLLQDRVGTPHISELQPDDDVDAQLNVEELDMGGGVELLAVGK